MSDPCYYYVLGQLPIQITPAMLQQQKNPVLQTEQDVLRISCHLIDPPLTLDCRFDTAAACPYQPQSHSERSWLQQQLAKLRLFYKSTTCEFHARSLLLSSAQIQQIKTSARKAPNVTLFIHGYNVDFGEYGSVIASDQQVPTALQVPYQQAELPLMSQSTSNIQYHWSKTKAHVYRDGESVLEQFPGIGPQLEIEGDALNGSGAHNWWLHMEYNLNAAAGFQGFPYYYDAEKSQYTRVLNVAWSGNPASPLDYMAVEPVAEITAKALISVIKQLSSLGIKVNAVAHSAGCIVLLKLMHFLGEMHFNNAFQHVFFWQAAMPWNVLSPNAHLGDVSLTGFWQTQCAYRAAKQIHVLYSRHDNILGPAPQSVDWQEKWRVDPASAQETMLALSLKVMDAQLGVPNALKSAYHVAHIFHVPFTGLLFDRELRHHVYAKWVSNARDQGASAVLQPTLDLQVCEIQQEYGTAFNHLAFFMSLYSAITHDGLLCFLANYHNDRRLLRFMKTLTPAMLYQLKNNIQTALQSTVDQHDRHAIYQALLKEGGKKAGIWFLQKWWELQFWSHDPKVVLQQVQAHITTLGLCFLKAELEVNQLHWHILRFLFLETHSQNTESIFERGTVIAIRGAEMAALLITVLNTASTQPLPAMGFAGVDLTDPATQSLVDSGRIVLHDQTDYLLHHGAMRMVKSEDPVFKNVYKAIIMAADGFHFGHYSNEG